MATNSNMGANWQDTNEKFAPNGIGTDNPGSQVCPNCRKTVIPRAVNGLRAESEPDGAPNSGTAAHSGGYHCTSCGHNFTWTKSTGRAQGPSLVDNTNQATAADM